MELRQLRYFLRVIEMGSFSKAAASLGVVTSALSQQISRLEGELATRLLQRTSTGVQPTDAGLAFWRQAQLAVRHSDDAMLAAKSARLSGQVCIGLTPTTAWVLGVPLLRAVKSKYPDVRLRIVESLSGHLAHMVNARTVDLAVLFRVESFLKWTVIPLLEERLFLIGRADLMGMPQGERVRLTQLQDLSLILPSAANSLRGLIDACCLQAKFVPNVPVEIDGVTLLMDAVCAGLGATIQPGAAVARLNEEGLRMVQLSDRFASRHNLVVSASDDELAPAAIAVRVVLLDVARDLARKGHWVGATIHDS